MGDPAPPSGPDFAIAGVPAAAVPEGGMVLGQAGGESVLLARSGGDVFAVGATCTHWSGPLAEGIVADGTVRCPWHHACFDLRTGAALGPAFKPIPCWSVEQRGDRLFVVGRRVPAPRPSPPASPTSVVILGGGAAGHAAAETVRNEGYAGPVTLIAADEHAPYDRPNVSKDYLAGTAPEEWMPLRPDDFYRGQNIDLRLGVRATALDATARKITLSDGRTLEYGALLIATGAEPRRLAIPGADAPHVYTVRTLADSRALIAKAADARHAVIVGAGFIGLEVASALRARNVDVTVVSPDARPLEKILGRELGDFVRKLHEDHGVRFRLGARPASIGDAAVTLQSGEALPADLVVAGIGVEPAMELAVRAGLAVDRGILVDEFLQTSAPGVFAAGDVARYPDPRTGEPVRVEHWAVAQRQGRLAARNLLGRREPIKLVPFFWSQHYDVPILYVGHAAAWDETRISGDVAAKDCRVDYFKDGKLLAVATVFRDVESLRAEVAMERDLA